MLANLILLSILIYNIQSIKHEEQNEEENSTFSLTLTYLFSITSLLSVLIVSLSQSEKEFVAIERIESMVDDSRNDLNSLNVTIGIQHDNLEIPKEVGNEVLISFENVHFEYFNNKNFTSTKALDGIC